MIIFKSETKKKFLLHTGRITKIFDAGAKKCKTKHHF